MSWQCVAGREYSDLKANKLVLRETGDISLGIGQNRMASVS